MNLKATLTKRENQVAAMLAWGAIKKEVAYKLNISQHTVSNTARNIYEKTEVRSVNELSAWWFCKNFNISQVFNPLLSFIFLALVCVGELNNADKAIRSSSRVRVTKTKTSKRKYN